jgi:hypothetical protein
MEFRGRYLIPADRELVWAGLNDPLLLKSCIPGCQSLVRVNEHRFDAVARLRVGPVNATFRAAIEQCELDPPRRCILKGEGQGGVAGFARGEAEVLLAAESEATVLTYVAKAAIGGKLAQVGQRLLDGAARQVADDFFARFSAGLASPPATVVESAQPVSAAPSGEGAKAGDETSREGLAPEIWIVGLIGVIVILLVLFGVAL